MRFLRYGAALAALLMSTLAYGQAGSTWTTTVGGGSNCSEVSTWPREPRSCVWQWTSSLTESPMLLGRLCQWVTVRKYGATGTAEVWSCASPTKAAASCHQVWWDIDGDGISDNTSLDGTSANRRSVPVDAQFLYIKPLSCPSGTCYAAAECH